MNAVLEAIGRLWRALRGGREAQPGFAEILDEVLLDRDRVSIRVAALERFVHTANRNVNQPGRAQRPPRV